MSVVQELYEMGEYFLVWPKLPASLIYVDGSYTAFFWASLGLSIFLYPLTLIVKRYHWIISWTLVILQLIFYTLTLLGISWSLTVVDGDGYLLNVAFCTFNGIFIGLVAYTFVERKQFQLSTAFLYMSICPFMIFLIQLYPISQYGLSYADSTYIFLGFEIYALFVLLELYLHLNNAFLEFKLSDYGIGAMLAYQPIFTIITRPFSLCFAK